MSATVIVSQSQSQAPAAEQAERVRSVTRIDGQWFVEVASVDRDAYLRQGGRTKHVTPEVGSTLVAAAERAGCVTRRHFWHTMTTWHFAQESAR